MKLFWLLPLALLGQPASGAAPDPPAYAVADGETGRIVDQRLSNQPRHPASLTKMMTLYLTFEAVKSKRAAWSDRLTASAHAAHQQGSVLGLKAGETLTLMEAAQAVALRSANDAAVALAEHLGASESAFADEMSATAKRLGLAATSFRNATGLSAEGQVTTAADMANLALALRRDFPDDYGLFQQRGFVWKKQALPNLNAFLSSYAGAEGLKTGFTCPAGYNLVAAAVRGGKRLIGVVLGAGSKEERESLMSANLTRAFKGETPGPQDSASQRLPDLSNQVCAGGVLPDGLGTGGGAPSGWALELAFGSNLAKVKRELSEQQRKLGAAVALAPQRFVRQPLGGVIKYRGLLTGLGEGVATKTCLDYRAKGGDCLVLPPTHVKGAFEVQRQLALNSARD